MVKLVVCDIDGTLIDADEVLSDDACSLVEQLRSQNICFSLASGRADYLVWEFAKKLNLTIPYITCNGAAIVYKRKRLVETTMHAAPLQCIIEKADKFGFSVVYSINGLETAWRETPWIIENRQRLNRYQRVHRLNEYEWNTYKFDKVLIFDGTQSGNIHIIEEECKSLSPEYTFTRYIDQSVEIVHGTVNKAFAMIQLASMLGILPNEILAVGDHQNDMEMIQTAGIGVAVGNAVSDLKHAAFYACTAKYFAGVTEAINRFCFSSEEEN